MAEALLPLKQLYGHTRAADFGPKSLQTVRQHLIDNDICRGVINNRCSRIKRVFKWAVADESVPSSVYHGLQAVAGLRYGRTKARESEPVRPVADLYVAAVLPFVPPQVASMVKLQRLTGMRPREVVLMRPCDINTSGEVWIYEPHDHKNRWRGRSNQILLGLDCQSIIAPFLARDSNAFIFSPKEAQEWRMERRVAHYRASRKTKDVTVHDIMP